MNLEHLTPGDWDTARRNFERLMQFTLDTGGINASIRFGDNTLTWPGGSGYTNTLTIPHGLGRVPTGVFGTAVLAPGTPPCIIHVAATDDTNVQWRGLDPTSSPAAATAKPFFWLVIG